MRWLLLLVPSRNVSIYSFYDYLNFFLACFKHFKATRHSNSSFVPTFSLFAASSFAASARLLLHGVPASQVGEGEVESFANASTLRGEKCFLLLYSVMVDDDLYTCVIILCNDDDNGCICVLVHLIIVNDPVLLYWNISFWASEEYQSIKRLGFIQILRIINMMMTIAALVWSTCLLLHALVDKRDACTRKLHLSTNHHLYNAPSRSTCRLF